LLARKRKYLGNDKRLNVELPIGEVDTLIAGVALSEGLGVASHNTTHLSRINDLQVVDWTV
jgi:predicted nucleic acid-binding protein